MKKLVFLLFVFLTTTVFAVKAYDPYNFDYKTGQIIITSETEYDSSTLFFELATGSRFGHVGIVYMEDGEPWIYESNPGIETDGAQYTTLEEFIERSNYNGNYQAIIMEVAKLTTAQQEVLKVELDKMVAEKIPYNYNQVYIEEQKARNCSEFIYSAYKRIGIEGIGYKMKLTDLNKDSLSGQLLKFWGEELKDHYEFVPPISIVASRKTTILASNVPHNKVLSDTEILEAWDNTSGLTDFVRYSLGAWWFWQIRPAKNSLYSVAHTTSFASFADLVQIQDKD